MSDDPLPPLRNVIARHGLSARKSLGQNFLFDLNLTRRIARAAAPLAGHTIVEVGPGPGGLTRALLMEGAERVVAVERDARVLPKTVLYARVSTADQTLAHQRDQAQAAGFVIEKVVADKGVSGVSTIGSL